MGKINILSNIDKNYFNYYKVTITSILENSSHKKEICFYLVEKDLSNEQKKNLKEYVKKYGAKIIILPKPPFNFEDLQRETHMSEVTYYKTYYLGKIKEKKIIYTDPDVIFLADIKELFNFSLKNRTMGGIKDYAIGLRNGKDYINAGILLIDLNKWRKEAYSNKCLKELRENPQEFFYAEQDLINKVLKGDITQLPLIWNRQKIMYDQTPARLNISKDQYRNLLEHPKAIHYTGRIKPWHSKYIFPDKKYYLKYNKIAGIEKPYKTNYSLKENAWKFSRWFLYKTKTREFFELKILGPIYKIFSRKQK